nr:hypothetical protein [Sporomusa ovata]
MYIAAGGVGADGVFAGVQQQSACRAVGRQQVGGAFVQQRLFTGHFGAAAIAAGRAAFSRNGAGVIGGVIGPHHDLTAIAGGDGIGVNRGSGCYRGSSGILFGSLALVIAADERRAAALGAGHVNFSAVSQGYGIAQYLNSTAGFARVFPGGVQGATAYYCAVGAAVQKDFAVNIADTAGLNNAAVVDYCAGQVAGRAGGHDDLSAISLDEIVIGCTGIYRCLIHSQVQ